VRQALCADSHSDHHHRYVFWRFHWTSQKNPWTALELAVRKRRRNDTAEFLGSYLSNPRDVGGQCPGFCRFLQSVNQTLSTPLVPVPLRFARITRCLCISIRGGFAGSACIFERCPFFSGSFLVLMRCDLQYIFNSLFGNWVCYGVRIFFPSSSNRLVSFFFSFSRRGAGDLLSFLSTV